MDEKMKVKVTNMADGEVTVILPNNNFKRKFPKKATLPIPLEILRDAVWDDGFKYMLEQGMLLIEDKEVRIELGLETPEENKVFALKEGRILKMLKTDSVEEMEEILKQLPKEQLLRVANIAIDKEIVDNTKCKLIEKYCPEVNILKAVEFNRIKKEG